ncbi:hypothetical protein ACFL1A_03360 [Patescibacteria group bacterium]
MKNKPIYIWLAVIIISIILTLLNSSTFFAQLSHQPDGTVYLGTIHYWEDYFYYLNHIFQGTRGAWLAKSQFTTELVQPNIMYWNNVMIGKIGSIFFLSPIAIYNISVMILSFLTLITSYIVLRKFFPKNKPLLPLVAFAFSSLSTSLINRVQSSTGEMIWWPFQIWGTPHFAFDRLGGAPSHLARTLFFYLLFILVYNPPKLFKSEKLQTAVVISVALIFMTLNPLQGAMFIAIYWAILLFRYVKNKALPLTKSKLTSLATITAFMILGFIFMYYEINLPPYNQAIIWESKQNSYTTFPFLLASLGPMIIFFVIGLITRIKKLTDSEIIGVSFLLIAYTIFLSPIPQLLNISNLRFLYPSIYIFFGAISAWGLLKIAKFLNIKFRISINTGLTIGIVMFLLTSLPTLSWEISQRNSKDIDTQDPLLYLPTDVYQGFEFLSHRLPYTDAVIASHISHMDSLTPALSGHTSYTGHMVETIDSDQKKILSEKFFDLNIPDSDAKNFLLENNIRYAIFTKYDGDKMIFESHYPFLDNVFENEEIGIYETK